MRRHAAIAALWALLLALLTLVACVTLPAATPAPNIVVVLGTPVGTSNQLTLEAILTREQNNTDFQAAATAAIVQANAQATLDSANATLSAAKTQQQNSANVIAAQVAAAAAIVRANALATLNAANSTQSAAMTQAQFNMVMTVEQQNKNDLAAGTQTAVANNIATQTQVAVATSQWYADQARQRQERIRGSMAFLWMWCFPIFIVLLAGLVVWGFWRWLKIRQANQRMLENPVEKSPAPMVEVMDHRRDDSSQYLEGDVVDNHLRLTKPVDQARRWIDEVKRKLLSSGKKDEDDHTDE